MSEVFVYGTLTRSGQADALLDDWAFGPTACLDGVHRVEGTYPTLLPGGCVTGRILRTSKLGVLDTYEGVDRGLYIRVRVPWADRPGSAFVYVGDPDRLGVDAESDWPGEGSFRDRVRRFIASDRVSLRITDR